jgi:hypothetical protein
MTGRLTKAQGSVIIDAPDGYFEADQHPSFWNRYGAPATHVAAEVQRPAHLVNGYTLAVAYMRDCRAARPQGAGE